MTDLRAAAEMALEYLEYLNELDIAGLDHEVHTNALRQALAQPEQEPVAWMFEEYAESSKGHMRWFKCMGTQKPQGISEIYRNITPLFTAPPSKQEPVAWISDSPTKGNGKQLHFTKANAWKWSSNITPLYTAPPSKPWVSLTDKQIFSTYEKCTWSNGYVSWTEFARTIEAASKELNT